MEQNRHKKSVFTKLIIAFCCFYTALSIANEVVVQNGILQVNAMHNFTFAIVITAILSLIWVLFTFNDK